MSDAEDGFDKEAEREKLREKYEADQEDREATQQMSELLLQGATMTNKHCDACGNPKFRYDGQTFCPNCDGGTGDASADVEQGASQTGDEGGQQANQRRQTNQRQQANQSAAADANATPEADHSSAVSDAMDANTPTSESEPEPPTAAEQEASSNTKPEPTRSPSAEDGDLAAARESVRATLTDLAARAERSSDAAHTRELLAATKEAAETLRELNRLE